MMYDLTHIRSTIYYDQTLCGFPIDEVSNEPTLQEDYPELEADCDECLDEQDEQGTQ